MSRNIEARLAKLEASVGTGQPGLIFAMTEEGETFEEFNERVERLIAESIAQTGCPPFVFKLILAPRAIDRGGGQ